MQKNSLPKITLLIICLTYSYILESQIHLSGTVVDAESGEILIGATIINTTTKQGTTTDIDGKYSLTLSPGTHTLQVTFLGYDTEENIFVINNNKNIDFKLHQQTKDLDEVVVTTHRKGENLLSNDMGLEKLQGKTIKMVPVLMGETDVIKVLQLMPGVQPASEGSTGFSVRGGNPDQNLVLLDGATIYNAGHLLGFFSIFNNDAVNDVKLYKGDMPATLGGRLSSVLDVEMRNGNNKRFHGEGGIGLISSRLTLEGPIFNEKTSFLVSARRTYFDLFTPFAAQEMVQKSKLYFYDLNGKINHEFNSRNRLFVSAYMGNDVMSMPIASMEFGNKAISIRYSHLFNDKWYVNLTALAVRSGYRNEISQSDAESAYWESVIRDYGVKIDFSHAYDYCKLDYGVHSTYHRFSPGTASGEGEMSIIGYIDLPHYNALENAAFVNFTHELWNSLSIRYGARMTTFHNMGKTTVYSYDENYEVCDTTEYGRNKVYKNYYGVEPRFSLAYKMSPTMSIKTAYSRTYQYLQQASYSTSGTPMDVWYMASPNIKPQCSDQVSFGIFRNFHDNDVEVSVEGFYKNMQHTIDFKDHPQVTLNKFMEGELRVGSSRAYGVEMMTRFNLGNLNGWLSYTWSRADRKINGINNNERFLSPYNHTHDCNIVANYHINKRLSVSANWVFTSGAPTTFPIARYEVGNTIIPLYSSRNKDKYEDYHRLDLSVTLANKEKPGRKWTGEWVFSFYNLYNHHNTWAISFDREDDENANSYVIKSNKIYLFPLIPSVSYNFKF